MNTTNAAASALINTSSIIKSKNFTVNNEQLSFDNRNYMKINNQQQTANGQQNLVSSLRERFENNNNNENKPILFTKFNNNRSTNQSPLSLPSSFSSSTSTSPPQSSAVSPLKKQPETNEPAVQTTVNNCINELSACESIETPANYESNLLSYYLSLSNICL